MQLNTAQLIGLQFRLLKKSAGQDLWWKEIKRNGYCLLRKSRVKEIYFDTVVMTWDNWPEPMTETLAFWYSHITRGQAEQVILLLTGHIHRNRGEYCSKFEWEYFERKGQTHSTASHPWLTRQTTDNHKIAIRLTVVTSTEASSNNYGNFWYVRTRDGTNHFCSFEAVSFKFIYDKQALPSFAMPPFSAFDPTM